MNQAIELHGIELNYPIYDGDSMSLRKAMFKGHAVPMVIRALSNISLKVRPGERIGIYGPNGAGKSTLLRVMSGIYPPTRGDIRIQGRVAALLSPAAGIAPDASTLQNIQTLLRIGGVKPTPERVQEIWEWTELQKTFLHLPSKMLSSGMLMKVLVATITSLEADILVMDEWLSVIDSEFMVKTEERLAHFIGSKTLILASHNYELLERTCDRIIHLEGGRINRIVTPTRIDDAEPNQALRLSALA